MSIIQYGREFPLLLRLPNPKGNVELIETIGKGNYGRVYKGKLLKHQELAAIKVVFLKEGEIKETLLEMQILEECQHENVTKFMGSFLRGLDLWIAMEYCEIGAVDCLYREYKNGLSKNVIASILYDTLQVFL
jgi:serine/threonine protein kinase